MTPIEDLNSNDLAWISNFVMQQMVIMLQPMMEHLHQTDATVDHAQHTVQRLIADVSDARDDVERTNKYLAILRQGLGVQNEGKCVLQRSVEGVAKTVKRVDDQVQELLETFRGMEGTISRLNADVRASGARQDALAKQVSQNAAALESLQLKVEKGAEMWTPCPGKDELLSNDGRYEVWQRDRRDYRRIKLDEKAPSAQGGRGIEHSWPPKSSKYPQAAVDVMGNGGKGGTSAFHGDVGVGGSDKSSAAANGSSGREHRAVSRGGHSKKMSRDKSSAVRGSLLQQDPGSELMPHHASNEAYGSVLNGSLGQSGHIGSAAFSEEPLSPNVVNRGRRDHGEEQRCASGSRLPMLGGGRASASAGRPQENGYGDAPRLRFSATMMAPSSRGSSGS